METLTKQSIVIDLKQTSFLPTPQFIQQDSNIIEFTVLENGIEADLSNIGKIVVNFKRSDKKVISRLLVAEGNKLSYEIGEQEMEVHGEGELEIQFYSSIDLSRISTKRFKINLFESIGTTAISEGDKDLTLLQELFIQVTELENSIKATGENAEIQANYAKEQGDIAKAEIANVEVLKEELNGVIDDAYLASDSANSAATLANEKASIAQNQADFAQDQGTYAKEQGDIARQLIDDIGDSAGVISVNGMSGLVELDANTVGAIPASQKGAINGVAALNADGKVIDANGNEVEGKITSVNGQTGDVNITTFSGDYNDLTNKPTIPNKTSQLTNDSDFITTTSATSLVSTAESNAKSYTDTHKSDYKLHSGYATTEGTANNYIATLSPALSSYSEGVSLRIKINEDNTGASTVNVNTLGAKAIKRSNGNDVTAGSLKTGSIYTLVYNGTNFILQGEGGETTDPTQLINSVNAIFDL
ncbi:hypothetical protein [Bacillus infantis]|uniref:hypothetical protein n=1 Tax=Bacillus infantis TaxID=324767 RepID=UPI003CEB88CA